MTMKIYSRLAVLLSALMIASCSEKLEEPGNTENAIRTAAISQMNANIEALYNLIVAEKQKSGVRSCIQFKDGNGYALLLDNGSTVSFTTTPYTFGNGDGQPKNSPMVGIRRNDSGFIWTLDGEELCPATSQKELIPAFAISPEGWEVRYGEQSRKISAVKNGLVSSFFRALSYDEEYVISFSDGGTLSLPSAGTDGPELSEPVVSGLRRPVSPQQPMWIFHIDTWLYPDPQRIIDLIPEDILPYVVFNISLSVDGDRATGKWTKVEYAYETAKSWLRTCAMNNVWAMIQPASGAYCHFEDTKTYTEISESLYAEFYRDYPNFIGFNYCEQFWGFGEEHSVTYEERLVHWTNLMRLTHEYGGYLIISCCGPYYAASLNPVAMIKRGGEFARMCREHPENLIICEKFTSKYGFYNNESACLGMWLSGLAGQYGIRFDTCGWTGATETEPCPVSSGTIATIEHMMLTGETVIDGPELIREECYAEIKEVKTSDGYTARRWEAFPQLENISIDIFRKIIDGTVRIPSKEEVIERTKVILVHDVNSGDDVSMYTAPEGLYDGLYRMDDDGELYWNRTWFKKSGRYPAIPYAAELDATASGTFKRVLNISQSWNSVEKKLADLNSLFPEKYTGDIFAGEINGSWVTYNPFKGGRRAKGILTPVSNSCSAVHVSHSAYSMAVIKESADRLDIYMSNYDTRDNSLRKDTVAVYGCQSEPQFTWTDRGDHIPSEVIGTWEDEVFTLEVSHNGPLDIVLNCTGTQTGKTQPTVHQLPTPPAAPGQYKGEYQFEAEGFEYKNISGIVKNGCSGEIRNYTGQGYMHFGSASNAGARAVFNSGRKMNCALGIKYMSPSGDYSGAELLVNGRSVGYPSLARTAENDWNICYQFVGIAEGTNTIELRASEQNGSSLTLDHIVLIPVD